jgi:pimeloyl-ACP methyl ester carboxylesterase
MPGPTSHSYFSQRLRLHYLDWGNPDAPPLLLIHGNRDHAHNWDWAAARLQDRYHVIAPDLRGHGDSQWSAGSMYAPAEFVYDIAQLVHQQELAPLRIVAHSLGGNVALRYAGTHPSTSSGWSSSRGGAASFPPTPARSRPTDARVDRGPAIARGAPTRRYATLDDAYRRMLEANPHLSDDQARHLTIHGANQNEDGTYSWKFDNYTHASQVLDVAPEDVRALWRNITCPVLLIAGSESWIRSGGEPTALVDGFADARHALVEGAGHWVQHDQLDRFLELVEDFLA